MRVKKLEHRVKTRQPRRRERVIISDTEEDLEDPSKQGRKITEIEQNPSISLVQDEGTSWIQEDAEIQGKTSADIEILLDQEEPTELVEDLGSGEKGEKEISTASATPEKKAKKQLEQERLGHEEAIRLQEHINEEEKQRIARDAEIAKYYEDIRPIFEREWDQNNAFEPTDSEIKKEVMKRPRFDFQQKSSKKRSREDSDEDNAKK
ncbi:hypothetical protein Tco_1115865 [Tanacetum coccineum]